MKRNKNNKLINEALQQARGDIIIAEIGSNASGVAVGKEIEQNFENPTEGEQLEGLSTELPSHLVVLYDGLLNHFSLAELSEMSFRLGIDEDDFPAGGKKDRARQIIMHCFHRERVPELKELIQKLRPKLDQ